METQSREATTKAAWFWAASGRKKPRSVRRCAGLVVQRARAWVASSLLAAGWAPAAVFGLHAVASSAGAYHVWPSLDVPMHLLGGVAIAHLFARSLALAVDQGLAGDPAPWLLDVATVALTCFAAVAWEFAEWGYDGLTGATEQLGLADTMLDLLLGLAGGTACVLASRLRRPARSSAPLPAPLTRGPA